MSSPNSTFIPAVVGKDQIQKVFISKEPEKTTVSFLRHNNNWVVCEYYNARSKRFVIYVEKNDEFFQPEGTNVQDFVNLDELKDIVEELECFQESIQFLKNPLNKCFEAYLSAHLPE